MEAKLNQLLVRTQAFHNAVVEHVAGLRPIEDPFIPIDVIDPSFAAVLRSLDEMTQRRAS